MAQINIDKTLFINAGAGSGKTYRLTNDLADYLSGTNNNHHNPGKVTIMPSEVIATTFTKVAAAEIKDRARQELLKQNKIQEATLLETSSIGTIHSVAQYFLNKYWYILGSCPNQDVLSDEDKNIYRNQSLAHLFDNNAFKEEREAIRKYFNEFQPTKPNDKQIPVLNPEFWAEQVDLIVHKATYYEIADFDKSITESCNEIDKLFNNNATVNAVQFASYYDNLDKALTDDNLKRLRKLSRVPTYKGIATLYSLMPKEIDGQTTTVEKAELESWLTCTYYGEILKKCIKAIFAIAKGWMNDYESFKREHGVIDYDDMEKGFYKLLDNKDVQDEIRSTYKLVMVDEFQDCNPIQLKIFSRISDKIAENSPLPYSSIWVGDPNQSIYGFRGSDTDLVNRVKALFTKPYDKDDVKGGGLAIDTLDTSYRSRDELIDYANNVFQDPYFSQYKQLKHNPNAVKRDDEAIQQLEFQKADRSDDNYMHTFARHLKDIVENKKYQIQPKDKKPTDADSLRDIDYKDIAILAKTHKEIDELVKVLREEGVPASAPESNILDRAEVQLVLAILNLQYTVKEDGKTDTRERPHELASLLRLWNNKTTEYILGDRVNVMNGTKDWSPNNTPDIDPIRVALDHTKGLPLDEKVTTIILELDLYDKVRKWGDADVRRQNLMTLQAVATQFVSRCTRLGIAPTEKEFYLYLQDAEIDPEKDNTSNSVRLFTYHGSKGLEWPMVILYSFAKNPFDKFAIHEYYGVHEIQESGSTGLIRNYYIHYIPAIADSILTPHKDYIETSAIVTNAKSRVTDEQKRLFYVGVTRARDYLVYFVTPTITDKNNNGDVRFDQDFKWLASIGLISDNLRLDKIKHITIEPVVPPELKKVDVPGPRARETTKIKYNAYLKSISIHEKAQNEENERREDLKAPKPYDIHDLKPLTESQLGDKYLHPSELSKGSCVVKNKYSFVPLAGAKKVVIPEKDAEGKEIRYRAAAFGSCIHNIFAVCPYDGSRELTQNELEEYYDVAENIIANYKLKHIITDVPALVNNLMAMFVWLKKEYGIPTEIVHEYPFNYPYGDNKDLVVRGEIDLVYCTAEKDVIIDFKNFKEDPAWLETRVKDNEHHFVGTHYVAQLSTYHDIWQKAHQGKDVETFLYYDILGGVVKV